MIIENVDSGNNCLDECVDYEPFSSDSWNGRSVTIVKAVNTTVVDRMVLCGERCNGEATFHGMVDTDENKSVDAEVKVESENGQFSGSVSGGINQDRDGDTTGKVEVETTFKF